MRRLPECQLKLAIHTFNLGPELGQITTGALKDRARRAIIKIDPAAAGRRRRRAERRARFASYGNDDQTATVAAEKMPAQLAAADDPSVAWRLIVTDDDGHALALTTLPARHGVSGWIGRSLARLPGGEPNLTESNRAALAALLARAITAANAYQRGGRACGCSHGGLCRTHHQLKQLPGWQLSQGARGRFTWTTPAGLTYREQPHRYPV